MAYRLLTTRSRPQATSGYDVAATIERWPAGIAHALTDDSRTLCDLPPAVIERMYCWDDPTFDAANGCIYCETCAREAGLGN